MVFSLVHVAFFVDISYEVSAWTESQEDDETTLQVYNFLRSVSSSSTGKICMAFYVRG